MSARRRTLHERAYRTLLRLYPAPFRDRFGDEMAQLFGDQLRDAERRAGDGRGGVGSVWAGALVDLVRTAASERLRRDTGVAHSMEPAPGWSRTFGIIGILGGSLLVAALVPNLPWTSQVFNLRLVVFGLGAIAVIVAIEARQWATGRARWWSLAVSAAAIIATAAHLALSIAFTTRPQPPAPDPEFRPLYALAANLMWASTALFGLVALRIGVASRLGSSMLLVGSVLAAIGVSGNLSRELALSLQGLTVAGVVMVGLAWIVLGIDVARARRVIVPGANASHGTQAA
ncbi:MAG: hypothetical protein ABIV26_05940 [Candidatus Limnocylindrales bacterium]